MCPALRFDFLKCWLLDPTMATMQVETHFVQPKPQQSTHTPEVDFSSIVRTSNFESWRPCCFLERQAESKSKSKFIELPLNELEAPCSQLDSFFASAEPKELYKTEEDRKWLMEKVVASPALSFADLQTARGHDPCAIHTYTLCQATENSAARRTRKRCPQLHSSCASNG